MKELHTIRMDRMWYALLAVLLVFVISGVVMFNYVESRVMDSMNAEMKLKAQIAVDEIQSIFDNARIHTEQMAINPTLKDYLKRIETRQQIKTDAYYAQVMGILKEIKELDRNHAAIWIANEKANFYFDSNGSMSDEKYDVRVRPWYPYPMGSKDVEFVPPYKEYTTLKMTLSSVKALRDIDDTVYGFVGVDVALDTLPAVIGSMRLSDKDISFLVGAKGDYIYNPRSEMIMTSSMKDDEDPLSPYADMIISQRGGFKEVTYSGRNVYLYFYPVSDTGWILVSLLDKSALEMERMQTVIFITVVSLIGYFIAVLSIITYRKNGRLAWDSSNSQRYGENDCSAQQQMMEKELNEKNITLSMQYRHIIETEKMAALGNLVSGVTHEVNTPISVALTAATHAGQMVSSKRQKFRDGKLTKTDLERLMNELDDVTTMIVSNLERAADLIRSFKQIAVDQSSEGKYPFSLKDNIDAVAASLKHEYKHKNHSLINDCPSDLMLNSYPGVYSQIFTNLIMNSIHHGFKGMENGSMNVNCLVENGQLKIIYTDDGIGISEDNLDHIFEAFFTTNRSKGNNGLGMHIIKKLIEEKLGGTIECKSRPGEGVRFTIEVPSEFS